MKPFTRFRVLHWLLAGSCLAAYLTGEEGELLHVWLGYLGVLAFAVRLLVWVTGTKGFPSLLPKLQGFKNNPSRGISSLLIASTLSSFLVCSVTGLMLVDNARVLGVAATALVPAAHADSDGRRMDTREGLAALMAGAAPLDEVAKDVHEATANATLLLVLAHIAFVFIARRRFALSMLFGQPAPAAPPPRPAIATSATKAPSAPTP
jgi:3-ketosteroid 9alpha-monooxygenase subunit B